MARRKTKQSVDINVVPYIDVMLVLLIIFMMTTPMLEQGVEVKLPATENNAEVDLPDRESVLIVSVKDDETIHISHLGKTSEVSKIELQKRSEAFIQNNSKSKVFIRADKDVRYENITNVMDLLKSSGYEKVGLITEAISKK